MAIPLQRDWKTIESLYLQGVSPTKIAKDYDVQYPTLIARIKRGQWSERKQAVSTSAHYNIEERAKSWRLLAIDAVDRFFQALRALPKSRLDKLQRQDVQNLKDLVETGLRAYGLDKETASTRITIGLYSGQSGATAVLNGEPKQAQVIDVQASVVDPIGASQADAGPDHGSEEK